MTFARHLRDEVAAACRLGEWGKVMPIRCLPEPMMTNRTFPEFFDPTGPVYGSAHDDNAAAQLAQHLLRPCPPAAIGWDPIPLERACRTLVASRDGSIRRIHAVIPCPRLGRGALPVVEYAETLAVRCGLHVHCGLKGDTITVTFEHPEGHGS